MPATTDPRPAPPVDPSPPRRAVVLLSGGLDSATALAIAIADGFRPHCLTIDYGQRHRHELAAARAVAHALGAAETLTLALDLRAIGGSALTSDTPVPKDRATTGRPHAAVDIPVTYVPARNLVFLSIATALAEARSASAIYVGVNAVDYSGYPDCRPAFIAAFQHAADTGTKVGAADPARPGHGPRIVTPLIDLTKPQIIRRGAELGVPFHLTHSCYDPLGTIDAPLACGRCESCAIRRQGFIDARVPDPTTYAAPPTSR